MLHLCHCVSSVPHLLSLSLSLWVCTPLQLLHSDGKRCPEQTGEAVMIHLERQIATRTISDMVSGCNKGLGKVSGAM